MTKVDWVFSSGQQAKVMSRTPHCVVAAQGQKRESRSPASKRQTVLQEHGLVSLADVTLGLKHLVVTLASQRVHGNNGEEKGGREGA